MEEVRLVIHYQTRGDRGSPSKQAFSGGPAGCFIREGQYFRDAGQIAMQGQRAVLEHAPFTPSLGRTDQLFSINGNFIV